MQIIALSFVELRQIVCGRPRKYTSRSAAIEMSPVPSTVLIFTHIFVPVAPTCWNLKGTDQYQRQV